MKNVLRFSLLLLLGLAVGSGVASIAEALTTGSEPRPSSIDAPRPDTPVTVGNGRGRFNTSYSHQELMAEVERQSRNDSPQLEEGTSYSYGLLPDGNIGPIEICREHPVEEFPSVHRSLSAKGFDVDTVTTCEPIVR